MSSTPAMPVDSRSDAAPRGAGARDGGVRASRARSRPRPRAPLRQLERLLRAALRRVRRTWGLLGPEQRVAAVAAVLLAVSTLGPFSWVEAAQLLVAAGVLALLAGRADRAAFHLPFGDGAVIAAAGAWAGLLIVLRLPSRSLGQSLLALACAALLVAAGLREQARRPPDDLPPSGRAENGGGARAAD